MGDHLPVGIPPQYVFSHPGQLSLVPSVGREMSVMLLCCWGVKARWLILFMDKPVGGE